MDQPFVPIKTAFEFLSEDERPDFEEYKKNHISHIMYALSHKEDFNGYKLPANFPLKSAEWQYKNWNPSKEDVLISAYVKTGTTWMTAIMKHILYKGKNEQMKIAPFLNQFFTYLESFTTTLHSVYEKFPFTRRIYSTHFPSECVNMERVLESGCKIICVLRNPKDQLVSWYHFSTSLPFHDKGELAEMYPKDWNKFFDNFITGKQTTFCKEGEWYLHHILSWYPYRNHPNVKFVCYEDLKKDTFTKFKELAEFVGCELTNEEINEIIEDTSLKQMKKGPVTFNLFRKGIVGDWKNYFTVAQSEIMDEKVKNILSSTDIKFTYK